jgi:hypothetical protein
MVLAVGVPSDAALGPTNDWLTAYFFLPATPREVP